jgi:predicted nucleic acid-binding Zn ribbon protein
VIDQDEQLRSVTFWKKPKKSSPALLGSFLEHYITEQASPKYRQFSAVEQAWLQVVPDDLAPHCKCDSVSAGQLRIIVDSPAYMYRLQIISTELIDKLGELCKRPTIRKLKLVPGSQVS